MPDSKKNDTENIKNALMAYEATLSPFVLAIVFGILGNFLDKHFLFFHKMATLSGIILGFIFGFWRLFKYFQKTLQDKK